MFPGYSLPHLATPAPAPHHNHTLCNDRTSRHYGTRHQFIIIIMLYTITTTFQNVPYVSNHLPPPPHLARHASSFWLNNFIISLQALFQRHHATSNIQRPLHAFFVFWIHFSATKRFQSSSSSSHQVTALLLVFCMFFFVLHRVFLCYEWEGVSG